MALVERAVAAKHYEEREERRKRGQAHDEFWCVFDVDEHPKLDQAISLAEANGIFVAVSSPCFELWLVLHYRDQTADISCRHAQARAKELTGCKKVLSDVVLERLGEKYDEATTRAKALDKKHDGDGNPPRTNPSSEVWKLIDRISKWE